MNVKCYFYSENLKKKYFKLYHVLFLRFTLNIIKKHLKPFGCMSFYKQIHFIETESISMIFYDFTVAIVSQILFKILRTRYLF